VRLRV